MGGEMGAVTRHVAGVVIVLASAVVVGPAAGAGRPAGDAAVAASVHDLAAAVSDLGTRVGIATDPAARLARARLDPRLVTHLIAVLRTLGTCGDATDRLLAALPAPPGVLLRDGALDGVTGAPAGTEELRACAGRLEAHGRALQRFVAARPAAGSDLEVWPVLRLDGDGSDDTVVHDYMLSVDQGGEDIYFNNAGGNLIDVRRGPPGAGAEMEAAARGCVNPAYDLLAAECVISEALLVDAAGNDTYGRMDPPEPGLDGLCTDEPLVHRVMTGGVGSWGVGILLERGGDDAYLGKSITLGAGHFGGVGMLVDEAGDDSYRAMRLAKGFGTLFGLGVFHDVAGDDSYSYYLPRPLDPDAADRTLGAGGGLDTGGTCDRVSRWEEGSGFFGGVGVFLDGSGDDRYDVAPPQPHEPGASELIRPTGSLGFGDGGLGVFLDGAGSDTYTGMPGRADGATVGPSDSSQGFFHDDPGSTAGDAGPGSVAGPGGGSAGALTAWFTHYIPDTVTIGQGGTLVFFNPDLYGGPLGGRAHTITESRADGPPRFDVFVPFGTASAIGGTETLPAGRYAFTCRIHPFMKGTLLVR